MTPTARVQAAIELVDRLGGDSRAVDKVMRGYFRERRYAGSKDRRRVGEIVFTALRNWMRVGWAGGQGPRLAVAAALCQEGASAAEVTALFDGSTHGPAPLEPEEEACLAKLAEAAPAWAEANLPEWLVPELERGFGPDWPAEAAALNQPAPLDIRVNTLKTNVKEALEFLESKEISAEAISLVPAGVRLATHRPLTALAEYENGLFEIQDAGSQAAAALVEAEPGHQVVDFCAGAGGKTLALAALMGNTGQIHALDIDARRLAELRRRIRRNHVRNVQVRLLEGEGADGAAAELAGKADRVLIDAPCSGTGAWRRRPEGRIRLTPGDLEAVTTLQADILARAAPLVRPGGRLVYVTCSVLPVENQDRIGAFLEKHREFKILPASEVAGRVLGVGEVAAGDFALLTPLRCQTDGFFIAILERQPV